ncbi:unnamed protein product [Trifolium pratense]|uniref:Uncharacterized protein n=1 Tax=Trifolium pratense TaxID=57577 RepID=A0ACB0LER6_TRIPR|nr:unnamed protein product [Trifolium pratense]
MKITLLAFVLFAFLSTKPPLGAADASNDQVINSQAAITKIRTAIALSASSINNTTDSISASATANFGFVADTVDDRVLNRLQVAQCPVRPSGYVLVSWKAPSAPWLKANTDGSVRNSVAACGAIFRDYTGGFLGGFSCRLHVSSVLHTEILPIIIAIEQAHQRGWLHVWIESDSQIVIQASKDHSIVPWDIRNRSSGASLGLASIRQSFPLVVVNRYQGLPLTFKPVNPKKGVIRVSTDLNIKFSSRTISPLHSGVWKLDRFDFSKRRWFVTTGGIVGNPGRETINNWFKIKKYGDAYKLVYCPSVVQSFKHLCKDVGVFVDEKGNKRLALSDVPLKVKFQQA